MKRPYRTPVKILFSARPAFGHVYPMMPLAMAARDAGHDVEFATSGAFLLKLQALGFRTHNVGLTIEQAVDEVVSAAPGDGMPKGGDGRPDLDVGGRLFIDIIAHSTAADLLPVLERVRPDLVIYEQYELGAAVAAAVVRLPAVCHSISPRLPAEIRQIIAGERLDRLWASYGEVPAPLDVFTGDVFLDIFPTLFQEPSFLADPARVPMRSVPWAEPGALLPRWVGATERPLVFLTLGTVVASDSVLLPAIEGLATLDADILVALGSADGAELGRMPANVHLEAFVNQAALLRHTALVVHHGGSGTMLGALANGKPQLVLPKGADQFFNADLMAAACLAPVLEPSEATPDAVATAAKLAMEEPRPVVDAVRAEIAAMPHPTSVLDHVVATFG